MSEDKVIGRPYWKRWIARHLLKYYIAWLYNINRSKLKHNFLTRCDTGSPECSDCGLCCVNCECYDSRNRLCNIWPESEQGMVTRCKEFPVAPIQLYLDHLKGKCRYYW